MIEPSVRLTCRERRVLATLMRRAPALAAAAASLWWPVTLMRSDIALNEAGALWGGDRAASGRARVRTSVWHPDAVWQRYYAASLIDRHGGPAGPQEALAVYSEAEALAPRKAYVRASKGELLARLGRWEEAVESLRSAVRLGHREPAVHYELAEALAVLGRKQEALDAAKRYAAAKPADPAAWTYLADRFKSVGRPAAARRMLARARRVRDVARR